MTDPPLGVIDHAITLALFLAGVFVLGAGAWVWGRAAAEMVRARAHRNQADVEEFTLHEAARAVEDSRTLQESRVRKGPPSAEEIARVQQYVTAAAANLNGETEYTDTMRNEGIEETQEFGGGMYRQ